jgi:hypothetical protein
MKTGSVPAGKTKSNKNLSPRTRQKAAGPHYHPATGQILSEVAGGSPYRTKETVEKPKKSKAAVTIAPSTPPRSI